MGPHHRSSINQWLWYSLIVLAVVFLDQWSKLGTSVLNTGVAFGWGRGVIEPWAITGLTIILLISTAISLQSYWPSLWWTHAIFSGAASGNLLDRWFRGGVRDPWIISVFNIHNNLADWLLVLVALYWVWYLYANARTISDHSHTL